MDVIEQLIARAKAFRIVSDVEEWLAAAPSSERKVALDFIRKNVTSVRHFAHLHCKLALANGAVWFGSANFTSRGMFELEELCFSSTDKTIVERCVSYFNRLWQDAVSLGSDDLRRLEERIDSLPERQELRRTLPPPLSRERGDGSATPRRAKQSERGDQEFGLDKADERVLRELYRERSAMQQQALEDLLELFRALGYKAGRDKHRTTIRAYPRTWLEYPLLNPRFVAPPFLCIFIYSKSDALDRKLVRFSPSETCWFKNQSELIRGGYRYHGIFVIKLQFFVDAARRPSIDYEALAPELKRIRDCLLADS
jgi:hypothetical protein